MNEKLDVFVKRMHLEIEKFALHYRGNHMDRKQDPKDWPMEMPPQEWDEQFLAFRESRAKP